MYEQDLIEIQSLARAIEDVNDKLRAEHRDLRSDKQPIHSVKDKLSDIKVGLGDIQGSVSALCGMIIAIPTTQGGPFIPRQYFAILQARLAELRSTLSSAQEQYGAIRNNGGVASFEPSSFVVTASNGNQFNLGSHMRAILSKLDETYAAWYQIRLVLRTPRLSEFSRLIRLAEERDETLAEIHQSAKNAATQVNNLLGEVVTWHSRADENTVELDRLLKNAQTEKRTIEEYSAEATTKLAEIRSTSANAAGLDNSINEYQTTFDAFDEKLASREKRFSDEASEIENIHKRLSDGEAEILRLTKESEGLLRGATNVGLAASFSSLQEKIGKELLWARFSFYASIGFLALSSLPLALYVFPGLNAALNSLLGNVVDVIPKGLEPKPDTQTLAQIAGRALLLIPGIWLVRFAGARHERLFRLREHYAYKFSVASSVEGFKKQAPDLEQAIAAAAFFDLTFNPATKMDANSEESRHPNPAMEWLMKKLQATKD